MIIFNIFIDLLKKVFIFSSILDSKSEKGLYKIIMYLIILLIILYQHLRNVIPIIVYFNSFIHDRKYFHFIF